MLTQICQYLRNWFSANEPKIIGTFTTTADSITYADGDITEFLKDGQYIRVIGSTFNDGVKLFGSSAEFTPETFTGAVWGMAVPQVIIDLESEIKAWVTKYADAQNSPYNSESFAGYSYTKASASNGTSANGGTWQDVFASRLSPWRKI